jgi:hypothetical protein
LLALLLLLLSLLLAFFVLLLFPLLTALLLPARLLFSFARSRPRSLLFLSVALLSLFQRGTRRRLARPVRLLLRRRMGRGGRRLGASLLLLLMLFLRSGGVRRRFFGSAFLFALLVRRDFAVELPFFVISLQRGPQSCKSRCRRHLRRVGVAAHQRAQVHPVEERLLHQPARLEVLDQRGGHVQLLAQVLVGEAARLSMRAQVGREAPGGGLAGVVGGHGRSSRSVGKKRHAERAERRTAFIAMCQLARSKSTLRRNFSRFRNRPPRKSRPKPSKSYSRSPAGLKSGSPQIETVSESHLQ